MRLLQTKMILAQLSALTELYRVEMKTTAGVQLAHEPGTPYAAPGEPDRAVHLEVVEQHEQADADCGPK
jgi:hypothetical protein